LEGIQDQNRSNSSKMNERKTSKHKVLLSASAFGICMQTADEDIDTMAHIGDIHLNLLMNDN
jgi:hypothetical protein